MPLLDLKTDLKSLKYGKDRPGGGDSGQPYQKVDINTVDSGFNRFRMTKFDDGLVRGGVVGAANAAVVDTLRIGKFLTDFPKGPLFIVKQVGLQLSNPALETKKITIGNGRGVLGFIGNTLSAVNNALGPTRIYNLGINTIAQVPVNAFGIHFNRHGLLPVQDDQTKYLAVAQFNNEEGGSPNNRLVGLRNRFNLGDRQTENIPGFNNKKQRKLLAQAINNIVFGGIIKKPKPIGFLDANKELTVSRYIGGPGSVYGIGNTTILRKTFTEDSDKIDKAFKQSQILAGNTKDNNGDVQKVKLKDTFDFEISNKTNSSLASTSFNLLNDNINNSFLNFTGSTKDYQGTNKDHQRRGYDDANNKIKTSLGFVGVSTKTSSSFIPNKLPDLTDFGSLDDYKRNTLNDNIASNADISSSIDAKDHIVIVSADLGLTDLSIPIGFTGPIGSPTTTTTYDIPKDIDAINKSLNQNVIPYTTPTLKKYAELRKKVNEGTTIDKTYITEISKQGSKTETFKTFNVNISRNDPSLIYNRLTKLAFRRTNDTNINDDKLALQFIPLDPFTGKKLHTLKFLGYITDYSENYDSSWNDVKYAGRNEKFYIFNEFKRTATVGFNIPCFNPDELEQKHCDMSELASVLAGKYQDNLLLGGIITRLKVGRYINDQPGIITNLTFSPVDGSSWDLDRELAFYLKVSFGFTLIHNFLPQYGKCGFIDRRPDPIPETAPEEIDPTPDTDPPIVVNTISDIPPTRIDNTRNANLEATRQRAEFDKDKVLPQTKAQTDAARKLLNSLPSSN
jgi:hypothetical protein